MEKPSAQSCAAIGGSRCCYCWTLTAERETKATRLPRTSMIARRQMLGYFLAVLLLLVLFTWTEWQIRNATAALASFTGAEWKIRNATAALDAANTELLQVVTTSAQTHAQNSEITNQFRERVKQLKEEFKFNTAARNTTSEPVETSTTASHVSTKPTLKIGMISGFTADHTEIYEQALKSQECYALGHGYTPLRDIRDFQRDRSGLNPWWTKVLAFQKYMPFFDWVIWLDGDVVVTRYDTPLQSYIDACPESTFMILADHSTKQLNDGVTLFRSTAQGQEFLTGWAKLGHVQGARWAWDDNGALYQRILEWMGLEKKCLAQGQGGNYRKFRTCFASGVTGAGGTAKDGICLVRRNEVLTSGNKWRPKALQTPLPGLNHYHKEEFENLGREFKAWKPADWWKDGDLLLHIRKTERIASWVPETLDSSCDIALNTERWSAARTAAQAAYFGRDATFHINTAGVQIIYADKPQVSCDTVCESRQLRCSSNRDVLSKLNQCEELKKVSQCRDCKRGGGPEQPMALASDPTQCYVHGWLFATQEGFTCGASNQATLRYCPCMPTISENMTSKVRNNAASRR
eukprot:COSAG01_NODE_6708_length_3535_cov_3.606810_1_plen_577_part_00